MYIYQEYTRGILDMQCLLHYSDNSLCVFYHAGLSEQSKARLPANGPCEDFAAHVQWVLVDNGLKFTIDPEEDFTSHTPEPESSPTPPLSADMTPEPTADGEPMPAAMEEQLQKEAYEGTIIPEPGSHEKSHQV